MPALPTVASDNNLWGTELNNFLVVSLNAADGTFKLLSLANTLDVFDVRAYGALGDGSTDDSTSVNAAITAALATGKRATIAFPGGRNYLVQNVNVGKYLTYDLCGSVLKLPNSAASGADIFRTTSFNSLTGGNTTGGTHRWTIRNGYLDGNRANNTSGRHGIAAYGIGTVENLFIHDCHGSALWGEWSNTNLSLNNLGLADGDQTFRIRGVETYDCDMATPSGITYVVPGGITNVSAGANPTITFGTPHSLRAGQSITNAGVLGATGVNGTFTVTTVPTTSTITITTGAPGTFNTPGSGSCTTGLSAMVVLIGMDSPHVRDLEAYSQLGVLPGSVGLLASAAGFAGQNIHIYQNFACDFDLCNGNNSRIEGFYCGGADTGIRIRQNNAMMSNWFVSGSFNNSIGFDYQSVGGSGSFLGGRMDSLTSGSINVRIWNTSPAVWNVQCVGDGGSNTSILYSAPNGTGGFHGALYNNGFGVNASPASLINYTT